MILCFFQPTAILGGGERSLLDIIHSLRVRPDAPEMHVLLGAHGPLENELADLPVQTTVLPIPDQMADLGDFQLQAGGWLHFARQALGSASGMTGYLRDLEKTLRVIRPDVLHTNGMKSHIFASSVPHHSRALVWHVRDYISTRRVASRILKGLSSRPAGVIANSQDVARDIEKSLGDLRICTIYNAIDTQEFFPGAGPAADLDLLAGLPPKRCLRVGLVATYARWKGQDVFLRAAKQIKSDSPVRFYIIGGPLYQTHGSQWREADLRAQIEDLGLQDRVGLVPFQQHPAIVYRGLDILVHASTQPEPFGRTIAEGMACGLPVIAAGSGGAAELIEEGQDGLYHEPGNADDLAAKLNLLASDPDLRQRLGTLAFESASSRFRRDRLGADLMKAYRIFGILD